MNILSLFDGCSMARQAIHNLNLPVTRYLSSEVDKYALQVSAKNWPENEQLGDIQELSIGQIDCPIDLLIGGSPCQNLSIAGDRTGLSGEKSSLFFEYVRLLKEVKPRYFLFENVASMTSEDRDAITAHLGVKPVKLDAADFSAATRKRYYWSNIQHPLLLPQSSQVLQDILQDGYWCDREKAYCIDASYHKGGNLREYFGKSRRQLVFNRPVKIAQADISGHEYNSRIYDQRGKSPCVASAGGSNQGIPKVFIAGEAAVNGFNQHNRVYDSSGKAPTIQASHGEKGNHVKILASDLKWRAMTPIEVERAFGLPDDYTAGVSKTQRHKMLGNGFSVPVIEWLLSELAGVYGLSTS